MHTGVFFLLFLAPLVHSIHVNYIPGSCNVSCSWTDGIWSPSPPGPSDNVYINTTETFTINILNQNITIYFLDSYYSQTTLNITGSTFTVYNDAIIRFLNAENSTLTVYGISSTFVQLSNNALLVANYTTATNLTLNSSTVQMQTGFHLQLFSLSMYGNSSFLIPDNYEVNYLVSDGPTTLTGNINVNNSAYFSNNDNLNLHALNGYQNTIAIHDCVTNITNIFAMNSTYTFTTSVPGKFPAYIYQWGNPGQPPLWDTLVLGDDFNITIILGTIDTIVPGNNVQMNFFGPSTATFYFGHITQAPGDFLSIDTSMNLVILGDTELNAEIYLQNNTQFTVSANITLSSTHGGSPLSGPGMLATTRNLNCPGQSLVLGSVQLGIGNLTVGNLTVDNLILLQQTPAGYLLFHQIEGSVTVTNSLEFTESTLTIYGNYTQTAGVMNVTLANSPQTPYLLVTEQITIFDVAVGGTRAGDGNKWLFIQSPNAPLSANFSSVFLNAMPASYKSYAQLESPGDIYLVMEGPPSHNPGKPHTEYILYGALAVAGIIVIVLAVVLVRRWRNKKGYEAL